MAKQPLFAGLIVDENDNPVQVAYVGEEPCYVVDDQGFRRHIPSEQVDRQVLAIMEELIKGHEDLVAEQSAKLLGQDDIFTRAMLATQLKQFGEQFDQVLEIGISEEARAYMGMAGFRLRINVHGEVVEIEQPGTVAPEEE